MAVASLQRVYNDPLESTSDRRAHHMRVFVSIVQWGAPGAVLVGWLAWPALTPAFKAETLGLKPAVVPGAAPAAAAPKDDIFRSGGKYKFVRNEIGERPTLEEDDE